MREAWCYYKFAVIIIITTRASERRVFSREQKQTNYHINEMSLKVSDQHLSPHGALGLVCLADWLGSCSLLPLLLHEGLSESHSIHQGGQPSPPQQGHSFGQGYPNNCAPCKSAFMEIKISTHRLE